MKRSSCSIPRSTHASASSGLRRAPSIVATAVLRGEARLLRESDVPRTNEVRAEGGSRRWHERAIEAAPTSVRNGDTGALSSPQRARPRAVAAAREHPT